MKIAWVVPGGVDRGGRERVIPVLLWLMEELAARHDLHVFALHQYPQACHYPLLGAEIHNLGECPEKAGVRWICQWRALLAGLRADGPFDVLHGFWADGSGFLAAVAGKWLRVPVIVTLAGGELVALPEIGYGSQRNWRGRLRVALAIHWARHVTAASKYMVKRARIHGVSAWEIPLGVHPDWFRQDISRPKGPPWRLLHVASLNRVKDQRTLLFAMKHIVTAKPQVHLDVIGEDTLHGEMQRLCEALGLNQHVFFHGFLPNEDVRPFFQTAHLLVMSSLHDAGPLVVLEAAASGLPSVGTFSTGYADDWHPKIARATPTGDPLALAQAILHLLNAPDDRIGMGQAAQQWAQAHDIRWSAREFEKLYQLTANVHENTPGLSSDSA